MERVKVCRVCLVVGVKMYNIKGKLKCCFISILGEHNMYSICLPQFVCYECAWLLNKYQGFKQKCLLAQETLFNLLNITNEITENDIKMLDRGALNMCSKLSSHVVPNVYIFDGVHNIEAKVKEENVPCPEEVLIAVDDYQIVYPKDESLDCLDSKEDREKNKIKSNKNISDGSHKKKRVKSLKVEGTSKDLLNKRPRKKSRNEDGLTADEVALQNDFIITILSLDQQKAEIEERKESSNYRDSPHRCEVCYKGFLLPDTLHNHALRHDPSAGGSECPVCAVRFPSRRQLSAHAARHAARYRCSRCLYCTHNLDQAKKHKQWHDGVTYTCPYCQEVSTKLTSHLTHLRIKHPSQFVCSVCGYSFVSKKGLKMHTSKMHKQQAASGSGHQEDGGGDSNLEWYCAQCEVQFADEVAWRRHRVTSARHADTQHDVGCRVCGGKFASHEALRAHSAVHAYALPARRRLARVRYRARLSSAAPGPAPALQYPRSCDHCSETILSRSLHWKHYQKHHRDKRYPLAQRNYVCEICGKGFQSNAFLVYHLRTHSGLRQFPCSRCGKAFYNRANLHIHARTHLRQRSLTRNDGSSEGDAKGKVDEEANTTPHDTRLASGEIGK